MRTKVNRTVKELLYYRASKTWHQQAIPSSEHNGIKPTYSIADDIEEIPREASQKSLPRSTTSNSRSIRQALRLASFLSAPHNAVPN